jgi:hypothetical protein
MPAETKKQSNQARELGEIKRLVEWTHQLMLDLSSDLGRINSRLLEIEEILDDQTIEHNDLLRQSLKTTFAASTTGPKPPEQKSAS